MKFGCTVWFGIAALVSELLEGSFLYLSVPIFIHSFKYLLTIYHSAIVSGAAGAPVNKADRVPTLVNLTFYNLQSTAGS